MTAKELIRTKPGTPLRIIAKSAFFGQLVTSEVTPDGKLFITMKMSGEICGRTPRFGRHTIGMTRPLKGEGQRIVRFDIMDLETQVRLQQHEELREAILLN